MVPIVLKIQFQARFYKKRYTLQRREKECNDLNQTNPANDLITPFPASSFLPRHVSSPEIVSDPGVHLSMHFH